MKVCAKGDKEDGEKEKEKEKSTVYEERIAKTKRKKK